MVVMGLREPTYEDVQRAAARIGPHVKSTPVLPSDTYSAFLKLENLQVTGAYKVRGALNALMLQLERGDRRSVIAASAGNHSAGMAWAARLLDLQATAVVPCTAPLAKI